MIPRPSAANTRLQHRRHSPGIHHIPPPRHLPRLARRNRRTRLRTRREAFPLAAGFSSGTRSHLHRCRLCPRDRTMATYGFSGCKYNSARFRKWKPEVRSRDVGNDTRVVWICAVDNCDDWTAGDDSEYSIAGSVDG